MITMIIFLLLTIVCFHMTHCFGKLGRGTRSMTFGSLRMNIDAAKQSLLTEISRSRKLNTYDSTKSTQSILRCLKELEKVSESLDKGQSIDGTWNLIYSTRVNNAVEILISQASFSSCLTLPINSFSNLRLNWQSQTLWKQNKERSSN